MFVCCLLGQDSLEKEILNLNENIPGKIKVNKKNKKKLELQAVMQGSKKCAFRRHNATRNVHFVGTTRSKYSKRYREQHVDIKVLTVGASVWEL